MLNIIYAAQDIDELFEHGQFSLERWKSYIDRVLPTRRDLFLKDMEDVLATGEFTFEGDYLPVLNGLIENQEKRSEAIHSFFAVMQGLEERIVQTFGRGLDATVVLYVGLCNGAGWVVNLDAEPYVLLGIEKIVELNWCSADAMSALIFHELGHLYQMQYGAWTRECEGADAFLWQLFTEGIAMYFEHRLVGDFDFFHQDQNGWLNWCDENLHRIKADFDHDLERMTFANQRYFGDWADYHGRSDVGYYLGARFVQWLSRRYDLDEMIGFDMASVRDGWNAWLHESA